MLDYWNDLWIAQERGLLVGARVLGLDHSSGFRRLQGIENRLDTLPFKRLSGGSYAPTPVGERMAAAAERMDDEATTFDRDRTVRDRRLVRRRVTSSETLAHRSLMPHLVAFVGQIPAWIYSSTTYLASNRAPTPADVESHPMLGWDESATGIKADE